VFIDLKCNCNNWRENRTGSTKLNNHLTGLNKWTRYAGDALMTPQLVCGGKENMTRIGVQIQSWKYPIRV